MAREGSFGRMFCCGDSILTINFPSPLGIASIKDAWVVGMWEDVGVGGHWR